MRCLLFGLAVRCHLLSNATSIPFDQAQVRMRELFKELRVPWHPEDAEWAVLVASKSMPALTGMRELPAAVSFYARRHHLPMDAELAQLSERYEPKELPAPLFPRRFVATSVDSGDKSLEFTLISYNVLADCFGSSVYWPQVRRLSARTAPFLFGGSPLDGFSSCIEALVTCECCSARQHSRKSVSESPPKQGSFFFFFFFFFFFVLPTVDSRSAVDLRSPSHSRSTAMAAHTS